MGSIPDLDDQFDTWQTQYATYMNANLLALGLTGLDPEVTRLNAARTDWQTKYPAHVAARASAQTARAAKDTSRTASEVVIRRLTGRLQSSGAVDDFEALPLERSERGGPVSEANWGGGLRSCLQADTSQRLRITIGFADEGTPTSRAKPAGVSGCDIWMKRNIPFPLERASRARGGRGWGMGVCERSELPTDLSECVYLATDTRPPYVATFDGPAANQTAHFIGRWMSTRNVEGPLSETVSATVAR